MMKRLDPTASLAMIASATVVTGALLALLGGPGAAPVAHAVERVEAASLPLEEDRAPIAQLVERSGVPAVPTADHTPAALTTQLVVLDDQTGLVVDEAVIEFGARVQRLQASSMRPITVEVPAAGQRLQVGAVGFHPRTVMVEGAEPQEVRLARRTALRGVVLDAYGAPLPRAQVRLVREPTAQISTSLTAGSQGTIETDGSGSPTLRAPASLRRTDATGAFAFDALEPGVYQTAVEIAGVEHLSEPRELREGEWARSDHRLLAALALTVQVDETSGLPAERARLLIQRDGAPRPITRYTDERGRAEVRPLPAGTYQLTVQSARGSAPPRSFTIDQAGEDLLDLHIQLSTELGTQED